MGNLPDGRPALQNRLLAFRGDRKCEPEVERRESSHGFNLANHLCGTETLGWAKRIYRQEIFDA
jgi:hypothetical protein